MTTADQVRSLIAEHLGIDAASLTADARFRDDLGADSLDAFELLLAFEETFGIEIPDDEADPMQRVSDAVTYIETRVASRPRQPVEVLQTESDLLACPVSCWALSQRVIALDASRRRPTTEPTAIEAFMT